VTERTQLATVGGSEHLADVELWQAVIDETLIAIWRAEITLPGHRGAATLLAGML